jgi:alcohol dehydrogenase
MQTVVYLRPSKKALEEQPKPQLPDAAQAIGKATKATICGADLHVVKGDVSRIRRDRILNNDAAVFVDRGKLAGFPFPA